MGAATSLNTLNWQQIIFSFLGGLGMFLFCIKYMGDGLQLAAGDRLKYILDKYTTSPFLGVLVGIFVTVLIQSSSGTTVITIGLVSAGLLTLRQAIGIIMGANIGTTITSFIIGFNISHFSLPIIFLGAALLFFTKVKTLNTAGSILFGFGGIFYALTLMSGAMEPLKYLPDFRVWTVNLSKNPVLGVFVGTLITMLVQASSATISILQNLYQEGLIDLKGALPVLFGDNIGTTITAIIAVIGSNTSAKRLAASHVMFNVIGTLIFLILLSPFSSFIGFMQKFLHLNPKMTIAFSHGTFNAVTTVLLFPFIGALEYIVVKLIKEKKEVEKDVYTVKYLDPMLMGTPSIALGQVKLELIEMTNFSLENIKESVEFFNTREEKYAKEVEEKEEVINYIDQEITKDLTGILRENLNDKDGEDVTAYLDMCRDIERIGDHAAGIIREVNLGMKKSLKFSNLVYEEVDTLTKIIVKMIELSIEAVKDSNKEKAIEVLDLHNKLYTKDKEIRKKHQKRLSAQECEIKSGLLYTDLLLHFTRVGDHARNLAEKVINGMV